MAWSTRSHLTALVLILFLGGNEGTEGDEGLLTETNVDSGLLEGFEVSRVVSQFYLIVRYKIKWPYAAHRAEEHIAK